MKLYWLLFEGGWFELERGQAQRHNSDGWFVHRGLLI